MKLVRPYTVPMCDITALKSFARYSLLKEAPSYSFPTPYLHQNYKREIVYLHFTVAYTHAHSRAAPIRAHLHSERVLQVFEFIHMHTPTVWAPIKAPPGDHTGDFISSSLTRARSSGLGVARVIVIEEFNYERVYGARCDAAQTYVALPLYSPSNVQSAEDI